MARKNSDGKYILSAGEIGAYTVCAEAWRLSNIERVRAPSPASVAEGQHLHSQWAHRYSESVSLAREAKMFVMLLLTTVLLVVLLVFG
jgi:hypothetical protein